MEKIKIGNATLYRADCFDVLPLIAPACVDVVVTDPPYKGVAKAAWDNQWKNDEEFLAWMGDAFSKMERLLTPTGSLYCFASPRMSSRVEERLSRFFTVLNHIVWVKPTHRGKISSKDALRAFFPASERILFCEPRGAQAAAFGSAGTFIFAPIRDYIIGEWRRAELAPNDAKTIFTSAQVSHFFGSSASFWRFPQEEAYKKMREYARLFCSDAFARDHSSLAEEYRSLKQQYGAARRIFNVTKDSQFTDVWQFSAPHNVGRYHPTQKPEALIRHMLQVSCRKGGTVLDAFMGSGTTGVAAAYLGLRFVGVERDPRYFDAACARLEKVRGETALFETMSA